MKATPSKIVVYTVMEGKQTWRVDFIPVPNMPGYSHRVAVNMTLTQSYLGHGFNPNGKSAIFFADKHRELGKEIKNP